MKAFAALALAVLVGIGATMGGTVFAEKDETLTGEENVVEDICGADPTTWSPFTDCESLADAQRIAGFAMSAPETIDGYDEITYAVMDTGLLQIEYTAGENDWICIRKAPGLEDISGDHNDYPESHDVVISGRNVTLQGKGEMVSLATWSEDGYSYSVGIYLENEGLSVQNISEIIELIR